MFADKRGVTPHQTRLVQLSNKTISKLSQRIIPHDFFRCHPAEEQTFGFDQILPAAD